MATGNGDYGNKNDNSDREDTPPPTKPQVGSKHRRDAEFDPYLIDMEQSSDEEGTARIDPYTPSPTPVPNAGFD